MNNKRVIFLNFFQKHDRQQTKISAKKKHERIFFSSLRDSCSSRLLQKIKESIMPSQKKISFPPSIEQITS
jgi:hypothetical protein